ncbi:MAG: alpha/beta fold hydrolase [Candidatus Obscuribacter phosphatis]|uniref:Alpha/beta fold hydrolase n=1 Tax=Candidatus Obscuribacter phosphatis TaxID=1906157 RepID=A0A8J7PHK7_9BACT|nr:alpha/beta fold hydrolase [Candidatus Obscuribacter phosphatis]
MPKLHLSSPYIMLWNLTLCLSLSFGSADADSLHKVPHEWRLKPLKKVDIPTKRATTPLSPTNSNSLDSVDSLHSVKSEWGQSRASTSLSIDGYGSTIAAWTIANPKAVILSLHGFGLSKESFAGFASAMNRFGISCYAMDVRGFGSWKEKETEKLDFYKTLIDVKAALSYLRHHNKTPIFLLGESMGGAVALQATSMFPDSVDGVIVSVPGDSYYKTLEASTKVALEFLKPGGGIDLSEHVVGNSTTNEKVRKEWLNDPKARLSLSAGELLSFKKFMSKTDDMVKDITKTPVLMFHGYRDQLSKPSGTLKIFRELKTNQKDLIMLGSAEHLIFEKEQFDNHVVDMVRAWIGKHCQSKYK